jgi:hypothetical protein
MESEPLLNKAGALYFCTRYDYVQKNRGLDQWSPRLYTCTRTGGWLTTLLDEQIKESAKLVCNLGQCNKLSWHLLSTYSSPQSRQNAKLFLQSSELGLPHPLTCKSPPFGSGGGAHSLAREGVGESQFRRDIHKYFVLKPLF